MPLSHSLLPHAASIVDHLPALIELALRYDVENNILRNQCASYRTHIDQLQENIAHERLIQSILREKIQDVRGRSPTTESLSPFPASSKGSIHAVHSTPAKSENTPPLSLVYRIEDSPVFLQAKRKGMIFTDEIQAFKKVKLDIDAEAH